MEKYEITKIQISSLKGMIKDALIYHYKNYLRYEKQGIPYSIKDGWSNKNLNKHMKANKFIKFEVQAYISQLRRLKHFIKFFQNKNAISRPEETTLKEIWIDLMSDRGVVNLLANKWAAHRSADDPKKDDSESMHLTVLLNLDGPVTMWSNEHMYLSIDQYSFYLFEYHSKVLKFIDWVFDVIETEFSKLN